MTYQRPGRVAVVLLAIAVAVVVAAGGSSSASGSTPKSGGTIKIMTLATVGSPVASFPEVQEDEQAAVAAINKAGGINGKKLVDIFCSDKGDVNTAETCARDAIQDHVVAAVGDISLFDEQTMPIFAAAHIPVVGDWTTGEPINYQSPNSYPLNGGGYASYSASVYGMKAMGEKKIALVALDVPDAIQQMGLVAQTVKALGLTQAGPIIKIPVEGVSDYAPYAQQLKASGAQGFVDLVGPAAFTGLNSALQALGSNPTPGACEICGFAAPGLLLGGPLPLATDTSIPGVAAFNHERVADGLSKVSPTDINTYSGFNAWLAVHAFADVAKTVKGTLSGPTLVTTLHHTSNVNVEGLFKWSPSTLGSRALGKYPRYPIVPAYVLKIGTNGKTIEATSTPKISDPIKAGR